MPILTRGSRRHVTPAAQVRQGVAAPPPPPPPPPPPAPE